MFLRVEHSKTSCIWTCKKNMENLNKIGLGTKFCHIIWPIIYLFFVIIVNFFSIPITEIKFFDKLFLALEKNLFSKTDL